MFRFLLLAVAIIAIPFLPIETRAVGAVRITARASAGRVLLPVYRPRLVGVERVRIRSRGFARASAAGCSGEVQAPMQKAVGPVQK